ncbi:interferon gamma receptor 1 [Syngnathus scovelli]|uniref:interferon gamma receptor 1 n=1 Tax=Syngnathus scovelli TaxID=161590 RepID=UPI002110A2C2|nr:interferon gamma receptor 1 isoform X1 [Syngnathus scovelli]XP_049577277.1 interferon gamma receptor 1 isoform X2 [Syngnathus scovelli]
MPAIVAFTALLMLLECALSLQPADVSLAPPTNVTVNCTDSRASVHWQYAEDADVRFLVYVGDSEQHETTPHETTHRTYENLSAWVWKSLESAMDVHYVSVAAVAPGRGSLNKSATFTYNSFKMADVKCKLAFPDVDVKADDGSAIVSFRNPLRHDPQLRHATRGAATLRFNATYDFGAVEDFCGPHQNVCRRDVTFPPGSAECVTLRGWVSDSVGGRLDFGSSRRTCVKRSSGRATLLVVLPSVLVAATLLICVAVVARRLPAKAPKEPLPKCLEVAKLALHAQVGCCEVDGCAGHYSLISVDDSSLSVSTEVESLPLCLEEEVQEAEEEEQKVEDDDEEGCWGSNYDCPHGDRVNLDMGDGDQAVGYMER